MKQLALVRLPDLVPLLREAGLPLLTDATSPEDVTAALRADPDAKVILLAHHPGTDTRLAAWIESQATQGTPVLLLAPDAAETFTGTRVVTLPASVDDVLGQLRVPARGDALGARVIGVNGQVSGVNGHHATDLPGPDGDDLPGPDGDDLPGPDGDDWSMAELTDPADVAHNAADESGEPTGGNRSPRLRSSAPLENQPADTYRSTPQLNIGGSPPADHAANIFPATATPGLAPSVPSIPDRTGRQPARRVNDGDRPQAIPVGPIPGTQEQGFPDPAVHRAAARATVAPVVLAVAGKGGVGKSTIAILLAERAAVVGGYKRVVLVDGNRGQDDVRGYLRVGKAALPSVYDAAVGTPPGQAILSPAALTAARLDSLPRPHFGAVLAPRADQADPAMVTAHVYRAVIAAARSMAADGALVIVDTQVVEAFDTSGLFEHLWLPMLADPKDPVWAVAVTDASTPGAQKLAERMRRFADAGVPRDRTLAVVNRVPATTALNLDALATYLGRWTMYAGSVPADDRVSGGFETGALPHDVPDLARVLDGILYAVTGDTVFDPDAHPDRYAKDGPRRSLWRRIRGGGSR